MYIIVQFRWTSREDKIGQVRWTSREVLLYHVRWTRREAMGISVVLSNIKPW